MRRRCRRGPLAECLPLESWGIMEIVVIARGVAGARRKGRRGRAGGGGDGSRRVAARVEERVGAGVAADLAEDPVHGRVGAVRCGIVELPAQLSVGRLQLLNQLCIALHLLAVKVPSFAFAQEHCPELLWLKRVDVGNGLGLGDKLARSQQRASRHFAPTLGLASHGRAAAIRCRRSAPRRPDEAARTKWQLGARKDPRHTQLRVGLLDGHRSLLHLGAELGVLNTELAPQSK
mmetsp:Transcript_31322/g.101208  ORF Transcript_31322/g.101208 Transcript_31322/m.101208 type:complete len:233 (+) Transcript_31322:725-1423(+)